MKNLAKNFKSLVNGNQFKAGTNTKERTAIMEEIIQANKEALKIELVGQTLDLVAKWSVSGKSVTYRTYLTDAQYIRITGSSAGLTNNPSLDISMDGVCTIYGGGNSYNLVDNSIIELV